MSVLYYVGVATYFTCRKRISDTYGLSVISNFAVQFSETDIFLNILWYVKFDLIYA